MAAREGLKNEKKIMFDNFMGLPDRAKELYFGFYNACIKERNGKYYCLLDDELQFIDEECDSPIEKIMLLALTIYKEAYADQSIVYIMDPQVDIGNYRVDFFISAYYLVGLRDRKEITVDLIVECDGHDFHEKTKEQVIKNNNRDYELKKEGYEVLHFSGSEIFNTPMKCAEKVFNYLETCIDRMIEVKG